MHRKSSAGRASLYAFFAIALAAATLGFVAQAAQAVVTTGRIVPLGVDVNGDTVVFHYRAENTGAQPSRGAESFVASTSIRGCPSIDGSPVNYEHRETRTGTYTFDNVVKASEIGSGWRQSLLVYEESKDAWIAQSTNTDARLQFACGVPNTTSLSISFGAPPAQYAPYPPAPDNFALTFDRSTSTGPVNGITFHSNSKVPTGSTARFEIIDCFGKVAATTSATDTTETDPPPPGLELRPSLVVMNLRLDVASVREDLGPFAVFKVHFTNPRFAGESVSSGTVDVGAGSHCSGTTTPPTPTTTLPTTPTPTPSVVPTVRVLAWSAKRGSTKIGRTAWVTPTRAQSGATVRYFWVVGGKVVDRDRTLVVKRSWRGKTVAIKVVVSKPGTRSRSTILRYVRVHG